MKRLLKKDVEAWLKSIPPEVGVGLCKNPRMCPLANYMHEKRGGFVHITNSTIICNFEERALPYWAVKFVRLVDEYGMKGQEVPAKVALKLLRGR